MILSQAADGSFVLIEVGADAKPAVKIFSAEAFPSDNVEAISFEFPGKQFMGASLSTDRRNIIFFYSDTLKIVPNTAMGLGALILDFQFDKNIVDISGMSLSVWPSLEYQQLYNDAWRLLRDYFYDTGMNGVDWPAMHDRYKKIGSSLLQT